MSHDSQNDSMRYSLEAHYTASKSTLINSFFFKSFFLSFANNKFLIGGNDLTLSKDLFE